MLPIIYNLKLCYKFFQEESFDALSDDQLERFEHCLENTERMIAVHRQAVEFLPDRTRAGRLSECLDQLSELVGQFWNQSVDTAFPRKLELAAKILG